MFEDDDTDPTEQFWYQNAGASGMGSSSYIDEVVLRDRDTDGNGTLDERLYYCQNWHHDVIVLCDTSGSTSERVNYDAYGSPIGTFSSLDNRKGYAGYEFDIALGAMYHVRHRPYRSDLGTWLRRDPIGYSSGTNLLNYCAENPNRYIDPAGLVIWDDPFGPWDEFYEVYGWLTDIQAAYEKHRRFGDAMAEGSPCAQYFDGLRLALKMIMCPQDLEGRMHKCFDWLLANDFHGFATLVLNSYEGWGYWKDHGVRQLCTALNRLRALLQNEDTRGGDIPMRFPSIHIPGVPPGIPCPNGRYTNPFQVWDPTAPALPGMPWPAGAPVPYQGPLLMILPLICDPVSFKDFMNEQWWSQSGDTQGPAIPSRGIEL